MDSLFVPIIEQLQRYDLMNNTFFNNYFGFFINNNYYVFYQVDQFLANEAKGTNIIGAKSLEDMVAKLKAPRKVMLLVKGKIFLYIFKNILSELFLFMQ